MLEKGGETETLVPGKYLRIDAPKLPAPESSHCAIARAPPKLTTLMPESAAQLENSLIPGQEATLEHECSLIVLIWETQRLLTSSMNTEKGLWMKFSEITGC